MMNATTQPDEKHTRKVYAIYLYYDREKRFLRHIIVCDNKEIAEVQLRETRGFSFNEIHEWYIEEPVTIYTLVERTRRIEDGLLPPKYEKGIMVCIMDPNPIELRFIEAADDTEYRIYTRKIIEEKVV